MALTWSELLQTSIRAMTRPAPQMARLTGSRRRSSSAVWASARRLSRIGIARWSGLESGDGGSDRHRELWRYLFEDGCLVLRNLHLHEARRIPAFALEHEFILQSFEDKLGAGAAP